MKLLLSVYILFIWISLASIIYHPIPHASLIASPECIATISGCNHSNFHARDRLLKRSTRQKCSPPQPSRRDKPVLPNRSINNATLWRRVMTLPTDSNHVGGIEGFVMRETGEAISTVWDVEYTGPDGESSPQGINNALFDDFKTARSFSATHLQGCTMLVVISRKGVYIGHYWESIAFAPDDVQRFYVDDRKATDEEMLQLSVLDGLEKGIPGRTGSEKFQMSLTRFASILADEHVKAYLIRPRKSHQQDQDEETDPNHTVAPELMGYPEQWKKMKDTVTRILPKIGEDGRWVEVIYDATSDEGTLEETSRGRVLFKFDPDQKSARRTEKKTRLAILWSEQREIHRDEWKET
ncbi:hypothetical protein BDU57DRAFT_513823 [Ampelomyces quisqualis]|uniref:Uncharacterized protein n=1 Tax=Ampelomyces quisqualis TaxID=50730 RepID=A0A6A5QSJ2_AMPQU|nr:hypothetical protein BDU57DRAFT_513823 [Ampelomyces quisqualis]